MNAENMQGAGEARAQKFPNLEVGVSMEYFCVLKKVSLSHGKKIGIWSFQIPPATPHRVIPFPFVYISHNNTYVLVVSVALI